MNRSLALLIALALSPLHASDPGALWKIVHGSCVPHAMAGQGPAPCLQVDLAHHYALLKDRKGVAQVLLIPTDRLAGIESPELEQNGAPDFWAYAWAGRALVKRLAPRPLSDRDIGLAINPPWSRSQNQLHIHIDCLNAAVRAQLGRLKLGDQWLAVTLDGAPYQARHFNPGDNPFDLLAAQASATHTEMSDWSLASAGPDILLATRAEASEKLLDHSCRR